MVRWMMRADMEEIDVHEQYVGHPNIFSIKLFYGGEFTKFPGRKYINGKHKYVDLIDIDFFCVHDIDDMMDILGYLEDGKLLYYHFKMALRDLDFGIHALASDPDICHLRTYVERHKLIEVYIEHGLTRLHTYSMSPNPSRVRIEEFREIPARRLLLTWRPDKTGEASGSGSSKEPPNVHVEPEPEHENPPNGDSYETDNPEHQEVNDNSEHQEVNDNSEHQELNDNSEVQELNDDDNIADLFQTPSMQSLSGDFNDNSQHQELNEDSQSAASGENSEDSQSDIEDSDFYVDEDNIIDDVDVDMREFFQHTDKDVEWVGDNGAGSTVNVEEGLLDEEVEVINNDVLLTDSSSNEGTGSTRRKSIRAIRRAHENSEALVTDPFYVFQTFASADELKEKIRVHAIKTRREIEFIKNDKNRVRAVCMGTFPDLGQFNEGGPGQKDEKCPWVLYASKWSQDVDWEVKSYVKEHRCMQTRKVKQCTYKYLSKQVAQQVESNPQIPTKALQEQLQREYQVDISKMKTFRAKTAAMKLIRGDYVGQYSILRDYILELQTRNPHTTVKLQVESEENPASETRTFKRIYICLGSLKKGFLAGKRDYLGLDGAFIKGPYTGMILTAVGLDGNNHTYPLAYAVVESENINSWKWFLSWLGNDLDLSSNSNFTFITDRQKGVLQAIYTLFPCVENRFFLRHIHENMKLRWRGKVFKDLLWKCATTSTVQQFNSAMEELKELNEECYEWLKAIPPQHWARSHFTGRAHCDGLLNNLCESFNKQLVDAREQPIVTCLEFIREYLMKRIVTVQKGIDKAVGPLTPTATILLEKIKEAASQYIGVFGGNGKYQVTGPWGGQCVVDMIQHTCSCRNWELTGMPCKHAVVAIWDMRKNNHDVGLPETLVHETYWLKTWRDMYSFKIEPINGKKMWAKSSCPTTLLPPVHRVPIGRPKKKKRKGALEMDDMVQGNKASRRHKTVTCSKCKNLGHNARSCKGESASSGVGERGPIGQEKTVGGGKKVPTSTNNAGKKGPGSSKVAGKKGPSASKGGGKKGPGPGSSKRGGKKGPCSSKGAVNA